MDTGVSLADIAAVTDRDEGMFGDGTGGMWIFALLILLLIGGGGFFGGNRGGYPAGEPVTEAGLCNAMNFNNLENSVGRLNDNLTNTYIGLQNGMCQMGYETLKNFGSLQSQVAQCCCETQRAIDGVNYNSAINTAAINANTTVQTQKILDAICTNRMNDMQNQINQLQLQSAMCGVVRYPNAITYNAGFSPFCNNGCCNSCNI